MRGRLIAAAEMWERLAAKLEAEQPLLQTLFELESNETYDVLPRALHLNTWEASDSPVFLPGLVSSDRAPLRSA